MSRPSEALRWVQFAQLVVEACVVIGYGLGLIPFLYLWSSGWVIPLVVISTVLALVNNNGTFMLSAVNLAMAMLGLIPVIGYVPRVIGIVLSLGNMSIIRRGFRY